MSLITREYNMITDKGNVVFMLQITHYRIILPDLAETSEKI